MHRSRFITTAVAGAAALAVAAGGTALAATGGAANGPSAFLEAVAKKLGVSSEKLQEATNAAATDRVDALLAAGTITEAQAAAMKERIAAGKGIGPGFGGPGHHGRGGPGGHLDDAAAYLGIDGDALRAKLAAGSTLAEVANARGKTVAGLKAALLASEKSELAEAVAAGRLTQAQADEILANAGDRFDDMIAGTMPARGPGHGGPGLFPGAADA